MSALESISGYNPETLLKLLPSDALYEERAILLGKMNQHELALSLYVHKVYQVNTILSFLCKSTIMVKCILNLFVYARVFYINFSILCKYNGNK